MNAKKISLSGITNPMSSNEMRNTRGGIAAASYATDDSGFTNNCPSDCSGSCTADGLTGKCGWTNVPTKHCTCATVGLG